MEASPRAGIRKKTSETQGNKPRDPHAHALMFTCLTIEFVVVVVLFLCVSCLLAMLCISSIVSSFVLIIDVSHLPILEH